MPLQATSGAASYDGFGGGVAAVPTYIEDVFSTYLYTGTGASQTITNGIDLSTKGGLVWFKNRGSASGNHWLFDSARNNFNNILLTNTTDAQLDVSSFPYDIDPTTSGFTVKGTAVHTNTSGNTYASWTFRKQPKFFDVVTWTGNNVNGRVIPHSLDAEVGFIAVKAITTSANDNNWVCRHRSQTSPDRLYLNTTAAASGSTNLAPTTTGFTVYANGYNETGVQYVAYLFAHNAGGFGLTGTDNVISCGSYTGNGSATGPVVTLGYEPQWLLVKSSSSTWNWIVVDNMRGFPSSTSGMKGLNPNNSNAEFTESAGAIQPTSTGFTVNSTYASYNESGGTYIYIAIRRGPMKVPTSGTSVFDADAYTGNSTARVITTGFPSDLNIMANRTSDGLRSSAWDRLRGFDKFLATSNTGVETTYATEAVYFDNNNGYGLSTSTSQGLVNFSGYGGYVGWAFRRAPSFFDEVCYSGTGANQLVNHNLGVVPELVIFKARNDPSAQNPPWAVQVPNVLGTGYLKLNAIDANSAGFFAGLPTATQLKTRVNSNSAVNASGYNYVAYLFATCAGVSKVGSYTGNGSSQTIDCGFTGGARFVLIKRTDSTGDWYVWDTARGIVAGNDPHLSLNTSTAEVTTDDTIDTDSTGFVVNQLAATNVNVTSATYIFLAIA